MLKLAKVSGGWQNRRALLLSRDGDRESGAVSRVLTRGDSARCQASLFDN